MSDDNRHPTDSELARLDAIETRLDAIESAQRENTAATLEGNRDAREMLEIFQAVKGGFRVLGWLATAVRWAGYIAVGAAAIYSFWQLLHSGQAKP